MILIRISFFVLCICLCASAYSDDTLEKTIESQRDDLESLVGRPFARVPQFTVCNTNSKGESVGKAYFKNSDVNQGNTEIVAWYWHPEWGFSIIASQNQLLETYEKNYKVPFLFYDMLINESGVVAVSFLINQKDCNICPWLWWSLEEGLHLSEEPVSYQLVSGLNQNDYLLIYEFLQHPSFKLHVRKINSNEDTYTYEFHPSQELVPFNYKHPFELLPGLEKDLINLLFKHTNMSVNRASFYWGSLTVDEFSDDLRIKGHGRVKATFKKELRRISWNVDLCYEISDCDAKFIIEKISEADLPHPNRFRGLDNKIIFEKIFN